jgi:hypothetical protein
MAFALASYQALERTDQTQAAAKFKSSAQITRDIENFKSQLASIKTPEDLYKNRRVMQFILNAYGLDNEINFMGRIKAVLNSNILDPGSVANRLQDRRYRELAADLLIQSTGLVNLKLPNVTQRLVDRYANAEYEKSLGARDPAVREARYFAANIGKVNSIYEILGDNVLRTVVTDTLGLPKQLALQSIESQAETIRRRLDISQFKTTSAAASATQVARSNALADVTGLEKAAALATATTARVDEVATRLRSVLSGYDGLAALQDPAGANAAQIAVQTAAIPELVRQRGLAAAAEASVGRLADSLNRMSQLRGLAADPANAANLADYKTEFASLATRIQDEVTTGASYRFAGSDQNLLDGSLPATLSTVIDSVGTTVDLRRQDLSGFLSAVTTAANAFAAVSDAGDAANLNATAAAISTGGPQLGAARDMLIEDRNAANAAIARVGSFVATLDTTALNRGRVSLADADARAAQIAGKLAALRDVAVLSAGMDASADRSAVNAQAATLRSEIDALIATPGAGADDLLGATDFDYALTGGKSITVRARGLAGTISTALAGASVADATSATALMSAIGTLTPEIGRVRERWQIDRRVIDEAATAFDPRGRLDESVRKLRGDLSGIVTRAAVDGRNLLVAGASNLVVPLKGAAGSVTITAQSGFQTSLQSRLDAAIAALPDNLSVAGGAYEKLREALTVADDAAAALRTDRRAAEGALLDARRRLAQNPASTEAANAERPTEFTRRFIERFLVARDIRTANEANGTGAGGVMLGLFA